jgi:adenylate kinase
MILRLILSELQGRGWLFSDSAPSTYSLSATAASVALGDSRAADDSMSHFHASDLVDTPTIVSSFPNPQTSDDPSASFLLDGFPRTASQAEALSSLIPINLAVHIHTPPSIILSRIAGRWVHAPSGRVYNETFNAPARPGYDDVTGERLTKRPDDDENVWAERLRRFEEESEPLLEFYQRKGVLVKVTGDSSDEITPKLCVEFERRFCS